jgi:hypothetical protein
LAPLKHEGDQLLHVRHARGELHDLVERAEYEVLESRGRSTQVVEHSRDGIADLADLRYAAEPGNGGLRTQCAVARPSERPGQAGDAIYHQPDDHESEHVDDQREEQHDLGLEAPRQHRRP